MATWFTVVAVAATASSGLLAACSPFGGGAFSCERDSQCGAGTCSSGYCGFADASCASGYRFGTAASTLSNTCVGDGSTADVVDGQLFLDASPADVTCFGTGFGKVCFAAGDIPKAQVTVTGSIDTDTSNLCSTTVSGGPPVCVIAGADVTTTGPIAVTGGKPLVIVATGTLTIDSLDIASHRGGQVGAGSVAADNVTLCDAGTQPDNNGGGAGGSFGALGGAGGKGNTHNGGGAGTSKSPTAIRGGCSGQDGKNGGAGARGLGGGALYLIANTQIIVSGTINASGSAGSGNAAMNGGNGGGGGGGAGGLIAFDSPIVTNNAVIFANGGGGGEGSSNDNNGANGNEPTSIAAAPASSTGGNSGGDGGAGGATTAARAGSNANQDGGGGGGGGAGAIRLFQATAITGNPVSPTAS